MNTNVIMNISWADIIENTCTDRAGKEESRAVNNLNVVARRTRLERERERNTAPLHEPQPPGGVVDVFGLAKHFGCGPSAALKHAHDLGWAYRIIDGKRWWVVGGAA